MVLFVEFCFTSDYLYVCERKYARFLRFVSPMLCRLLELGRNMNKADTEGIRQCAHFFKQMDQVLSIYVTRSCFSKRTGSQCAKFITVLANSHG